MSRLTADWLTSVHKFESIALNYSLSGGRKKVVNPPYPAAPNTTLCLCSSGPSLRIMFSSADAFSNDQSSTQTKRRMYTVSTSQQTESMTQQPFTGISVLVKLQYIELWTQLKIYGQFMVRYIVQLSQPLKCISATCSVGFLFVFVLFFNLFFVFFVPFVPHILFKMQ